MSQRTGQTTILLDLGSGEYFSLDDVGAELWERCRGEMSVAEIAAALEEQWQVPRDVLEADLLELLNDLHGAGLIDYV